MTQGATADCECPLYGMPVIKTFTVLLGQHPAAVTESKFQALQKGMQILSKHPLTSDHVITIQDIEKQELDVSKLREE